MHVLKDDFLALDDVTLRRDASLGLQPKIAFDPGQTAALSHSQWNPEVPYE